MAEGLGFSEIAEAFAIKPVDERTFSPLALAFIGDAVYEVVARTLVLERGNAPAARLHKEASKFVKAKAQHDAFLKIEPLLVEDEADAYRRGRNANPHTWPKSATMTEYRVATGYEALIGYLYFKGRNERILELIKAGLTEGSAE